MPGWLGLDTGVSYTCIWAYAGLHRVTPHKNSTIDFSEIFKKYYLKFKYGFFSI